MLEGLIVYFIFLELCVLSLPTQLSFQLTLLWTRCISTKISLACRCRSYLGDLSLSVMSYKHLSPVTHWRRNYHASLLLNCVSCRETSLSWQSLSPASQPRLVSQFVQQDLKAGEGCMRWSLWGCRGPLGKPATWGSHFVRETVQVSHHFHQSPLFTSKGKDKFHWTDGECVWNTVFKEVLRTLRFFFSFSMYL